MNVKQFYFPTNLEPIHSNTDGKNGRFIPSNLSDVVVTNDKVSENHYMLRLQEMEELNAHLKGLLEQRSQELADVVSTNAKFISIIAHDLRSPFNAILGVLGLLNGYLDEYNTHEIKKFIKIASNSASKTYDLLESLLEWAISQNMVKSFDPVRIHLCELVTGELENAGISALQKQITLHHSIAPGLDVTADMQMVKTVLRNLISNAIKFTNKGGEITISANETGSFVEIAVKDNGVGISHKTQKELFKKESFRSTIGTGGERGGGLGLLLCKEFVELHGGSIFVKSSLGKGSVFTFTLPHYL
jgi:signal transduction histidine kinase